MLHYLSREWFLPVLSRYGIDFDIVIANGLDDIS